MMKKAWVGGFGAAFEPDLKDVPLSRRDKRRLDRPSALALSAALLAMGDGALWESYNAGGGVILGSRWGCTHTNDAFLAHLGPEPGAVDPIAASLFKHTVPNAPGAWIAMAYKMSGPNRTLLGPEGPNSPQSLALAQALALLEHRQAPWMLVGAVDVPPEGKAPNSEAPKNEGPEEQDPPPYAAILRLLPFTPGQDLGLPLLTLEERPPLGDASALAEAQTIAPRAILGLISHLKDKDPTALNIGLTTQALINFDQLP